MKTYHTVNAVGMKAPTVHVMHHPQGYREAKFECINEHEKAHAAIK